MTIREIFKQDSECERLIEDLQELQDLCDEDIGSTEIGYTKLEDLKDCLLEFRKYIELIGNLDVYNLISERLEKKV